MKSKQWYEIYGKGPHSDSELLAKVKSKGLAFLVATYLKTLYTEVKVV